MRNAWKPGIVLATLIAAGCSSPGGGGGDPGVADTPPDATAGDEAAAPAEVPDEAVEPDEGGEATADPGADVAEDPAPDQGTDPTPDTAPDAAGDSPGEADASPPPVIDLPESVVAAAASSCPDCVVLASETWDASTTPRFPSLADYTQTIEGQTWHFRPWIRFRMPHPGKLLRLYAFTKGAGAVSVALTTGFPGGHYPCLDEATGDDPWAVGATRRMAVTAEPGWRAIDLGGLDWTVPGYDEVLLLLGQEGDARIGLASPVPPGSGDYLVNGGLIADAPGDGLACFPSMSQFEDDAGAPQLWIARLEVETQGVAQAHWFEAASTVEYGGHAALGDADGDGDDDLLAGGRLFRNDGAGGLEDVTAAAGLAGVGGETLWGDFDNDGARDILVVAGGVRLFRNNGDGTFADVTAASGAVAPASLQGAAWLDYDLDGDLDFFVASYGTLADPEVGTRDYLFRNNGDGTFTDVTEAVHIPVKEGTGYHGRGVCVADHDGDGDPDIYLGNYRLNPNQLWENRGADGFKDVAATAGVAGTWFMGGAYGHTIGPSFGDLDGDGRWDIVVPNLAHPRFADWSDPTYLHFAKGDGTYTTTPGADRGIRFDETHSDSVLFDADDDGALDLYLTAVYEGRRSYLYRNDGTGQFEDATYAAGIRHYNGWGAAAADLDGDGRTDLVAGRLYLNRHPSSGNRLDVRLRGGARPGAAAGWSNRDAIGAEVVAVVGGRTLLRQVEGGKGVGCQNGTTVHLGLGAAAKADSLTVRWPSGRKTERKDVAAGQVIVIDEPAP